MLNLVEVMNENKIIVYILIVLFAALCLYGRKINPKRSLHGDARFATRKEVKDAGLFGSDGIIVGKAFRKYLIFGGSQHISMIAPTRSEKGVSTVIPNLLNWNQSAFVFDNKAECFGITSKFREMCGHAVFKFDPFDLKTHQWNPFYYLSDEHEKRIPEILSIGHMLYPRPSHGETVWQDTSRDLFMGCVMYQCETRGFSTMGEVLRMFSGKGKPLKEYLQGLIDNNELSENCVYSLNRFINAPANMAGSIVGTAQAPLTLWSSPIVDAATSGNSFDFRELRKRKMTIYFCVPSNKQAEAQVIKNLFISQLINMNMDGLEGSSPELKYKCLLLLDEFPKMGYIPIIDTAAADIAGYGMRMLTIAQSKSYLSRSVAQGGYGPDGAEALLDNHALNIMFAPKGKDAEEYSKLLGSETVKAKSVQTRNRWHGTESERERPLMMPQELRDMSKDRAIIKLENTKPIKAKKIRYYNDPVFLNRIKSVSPTLAKIRRPTEQQMRDAWPELTAYVPTNTIAPIKIYQAERVVKAAKPADVKNGVDLDRLAIELPPVPKGKMSDTERAEYADSFWESLNPQEPSVDTQGEIIDLSVLKQDSRAIA